MKYFRIELIFRGISESIVEMALGADIEVHDVDARGSWDFVFLGEKSGPTGAKMVEYKVVTPLLTKNDLYIIIDFLESLSRVGCIIGCDRPVRIHFLEKRSKRWVKKVYSERETKAILFELVSGSHIFKTLLLYRKYYSKLPFYSRRCKPDGKEFVSYNAYYNTINNRAVSSIVELYITNALLKGARPSNF